jgi:maltose O-acetyltransferase
VAMPILSGVRIRGVGRIRNWWERQMRETIVNGISSSAIPPDFIRLGILRAWGLEIGRCRIEPRCWFGNSDVRIGDHCIIMHGALFDNAATIQIGASTMMGMNVSFVTSDHQIGDSACRMGRATPAPITIGEGCWIGTNVMFLSGVTVGDGCVIGAGAVVRKDCEPNGLYLGVPATRIRTLE